MQSNMEEIYKQHAQMVYKYLLRLTGGNAHLAEEMTQETFYQAVKSIEKFDYSCKITTWLCAIAKNQLQTHRRKNPQMEDIADESCINGNHPSAEQDVLASENKTQLLKRLHLCPEPYREIMYLRIFGNLSFKEIGDIFGKTENWARVSFYRGKEQLRKEIEKDE